MIDINSLPIEAFVHILKHTDGITLGKCRRVCRKWKDCIDGTDWLWHEICKNEFKYSSKIAKEKSGSDCDWYHIYKNLKMWSDVTSFDRNVREFYKFSLHDKNHALDINYNLLPLQGTAGVHMYDMITLKRIPGSIPVQNCLKIANNGYATIILLKYGLFIQRTIVDNITDMSEAFYKADNFILSDDTVYFFNNRDIYKCDLTLHNLTAILIIHCDFDIKEIQYDNNVLHIFTDCGKIVNVFKDKSTELKPIHCPPELVKQINVQAMNDKNFVCYLDNLFKIETDKYQHLYLDFPPITALFFYNDIVLIGTCNGEILLYRLSSQIPAIKPIFENLAVLPEGKFAVQLDVCERKSGPVIVAATFFEIYLIEIDFFPNDKEQLKSTNKLFMYKRLLRLEDRIRTHIAKLLYKQRFRRV